MNVAAHFAEMAFHRFPRALRGDAHFLVVVAVAAAGGESIAQPETARLRNAVGEVGETGGTLVGGDDQIRVIAIVAQHVVGRDHLSVRCNVVGQVEKRVDEGFIGRNRNRLCRLARRTGRNLFGIEPAFGADGHDDGVLHLLRLDEAQHLGAEILPPVGPANAAARHPAKAQMHAFHLRRVNEDFNQWPRCGQFVQRMGIELEGEIGPGPAVFARLIKIGPQHGADHIANAANDAIVIEARHRVERGFDAAFDGFGIFRIGTREVVAGMEQRHQQRRNRGVARQCLLDIILTEGKACLA